jgi:hypothetical protein
MLPNPLLQGLEVLHRVDVEAWVTSRIRSVVGQGTRREGLGMGDVYLLTCWHLEPE